MKNKISLIGLILYIVLYIILLFTNSYLININIYLASCLVNNMDKINGVAEYIYEIECFLFYIGLSIFITILCIERNNSIKYIIIFSILFSLVIDVFALIVKSYIATVSLINSIVIIVSSMLGVLIELLIKIKQVRRE
ncbi:MAG: hypothetical protein MRZ17_01835 [Acholeplasmataceae bacterium]|nr:hypothetical protein [Acholeplasmataceae bacterium]